MNANVEMLCNQTISNAEISIMFWTLIVTIFSLVVTVIISIIGNHQNAKLNSITMLKDNVGETFNRILLNDFCENAKDCNCKFFSSNETGEIVLVSFDVVPLIKLRNKVSEFLGEVAYLQYAIPFRFSRLNSAGQNVMDFIENEMLPYAIFAEAPNKIEDGDKKTVGARKGKKIYRKFLRKVKKFYKKAFKIYKYGL